MAKKKAPGGHKNPAGKTHTTVGKLRELEARLGRLEQWAATLYNPDKAPASYPIRKGAR